MPRAIALIRKAAVALEKGSDTLTLAHQERSHVHGTLISDGGAPIVMGLEKAVQLYDGDALKLQDERLVLIKSAVENILEITAENPVRLIRLAWQCGNHHIGLEASGEKLYCLDNPANAELIRGQGCLATPVKRPFQPEKAAHHHHDHHHDHSHNHAHHDCCGHQH
jgi:urease accessory protein